jgi:hypothetical protein
VIGVLCLAFAAMRTPDPTAGPAADSIRVDLAGLARLAANLKSLAVEMAGRDGGLQDALADPDLAAALRHAERDWWDQRRRLKAFLDSAAQAVSESAKAYQAVETEIGRAASAGAR